MCVQRKMGKNSWFPLWAPGRYDLERPNPVFQENTRYGSQTWWFIDLILSTNSNFIPCSWVEEWRCCIELEVYEICTNASSQLKWFVPLTVPPRHQCHNWTSPHTFTSFQLSVIKSYQRGVNGRNAKVDLMFTKESSCRPFWSFLQASWTPEHIIPLKNEENTFDDHIPSLVTTLQWIRDKCWTQYIQPRRDVQCALCTVRWTLTVLKWIIPRLWHNAA